MTHIHDLIGVGFGPNNIALAVHLAERSTTIDALFLEARPSADWHPGMLLDTADIQHAPARDFISPIDPRSHFSFLHFLKKHDRLLAHFNTPTAFPLRKEWSAYIRWVAEHFLDQVRFDSRVAHIRVVEEQGESLWEVELTDRTRHLARALSVATGQSPLIPEVFESWLGEQVFHLNEYRQRIDRLARVFNDLRVAVIGASQSATEILIDLHRRPGVAAMHTVMRGFSLRQKDLSPFTEHLFFPEVVDWFQGLDEATRRQVNQELGDAVYARSDKDALDALYRAHYEDRLDGIQRLHLHPYAEVSAIERRDQGLQLRLADLRGDEQRTVDCDAVVLATGFRRLGPGASDEKTPQLLKEVAGRFEREPSGCVRIDDDYAMQAQTDRGGRLPVYLNGLAVSSHGLGDAGSFPLLAYRADTIARSLGARRRRSRRLRVTL